LSGFPPQKPAGAGGIPGQPTNLSVNHGAQLSSWWQFNPVFGAVIYNYRLLANTPGGAVIEQDTATNAYVQQFGGGVKYHH